MGLLLGIGTLGWVLYFALSGGHLSTLLNAHSIVIVCVGTIGVLFVSTPPKTLRALFDVATGRYRAPSKVILIHQAFASLLKSHSAPVGNVHPLVNRAIELWGQGVDPHLFETLMYQRAQAIEQSSAKAVAALKNLAKYPPALGMTGTVMGLVSLFSDLTPDKKSLIGPNLALAMTATFYGLTLANMVIMPLSDRLQIRHLEDSRLNEHVLKALILIHRGEPRSVLEGELKSYAA